jgi:transcriptional regulator with XRE-family HTH domain
MGLEPLEELITARRKEMAISRGDIAKCLGIRDTGMIGMVESGARRYALHRLPALAEFLHLDARELIKTWMQTHAPQCVPVLFQDDYTSLNVSPSGPDRKSERSLFPTKEDSDT